jgi:uncharacterized Fe-S radical SAM superfamily protein PflX
VAAPEKLMPLLAGVSPDLCLNVLSQYRPVYRAARFPVIARGSSAEEVASTVALAKEAGLRNVLLDGQPA